MRVYTVGSVERLLRSYLTIRNVIAGNAPASNTDNAYSNERPTFMRKEQPLGQLPRETRAWPFMEIAHARPPKDGKAQARAREELHCAALDIENAIFAHDRDGHPLLSQEDRFIVAHYFILGNYTLDEMCKVFGTTSRGSMQRRCHRAVERLVKVMESPHAT